jgi:hypothetical protein
MKMAAIIASMFLIVSAAKAELPMPQKISAPEGIPAQCVSLATHQSCQADLNVCVDKLGVCLGQSADAVRTLIKKEREGGDKTSVNIAPPPVDKRPAKPRPAKPAPPATPPSTAPAPHVPAPVPAASALSREEIVKLIAIVVSNMNLKGAKGDKGDKGTKGDKGDPGETILVPSESAKDHFAIGLGGMATAIRSSGRPDAFGAAPSLQLRLLGEKNELVLEGAYGPGREEVRMLHLSYAHYVREYLGISGGAFGEWIGLVGNDARYQIFGGTFGLVFRKRMGPADLRGGLSAFAGANGFDPERMRLSYGGLAHVSATVRF